MKPEISRIIVVRRETDGRFARAKRGIIFADRGKRGRSEKSNRGKTDRGNRGPSCEQQQTRVPRRRNKRERERGVYVRVWIRQQLSRFPPRHFQRARDIYMCIYIYLGARRSFFFLRS